MYQSIVVTHKLAFRHVGAGMDDCMYLDMEQIKERQKKRCSNKAKLSEVLNKTQDFTD